MNVSEFIQMRSYPNPRASNVMRDQKDPGLRSYPDKSTNGNGALL